MLLIFAVVFCFGTMTSRTLLVPSFCLNLLDRTSSSFLNCILDFSSVLICSLSDCIMLLNCFLLTVVLLENCVCLILVAMEFFVVGLVSCLNTCCAKFWQGCPFSAVIPVGHGAQSVPLA